MYPAIPSSKYIPSGKSEVLHFKDQKAVKSTYSIPAVNIFETNNEYYIIIAVPGFYRDDFKIEIAEGIITISAKREMAMEEKKVNDRREYDFTEWTRAFHLPDDADEFLAYAVYQKGELNIIIPRSNKSENKAKATIYVY